MLNPWEYWSAEQIAAATACPVADITENWPKLYEALAAHAINGKLEQQAAIATTAIETASTFRPVREAFWLSEDWRRRNLRYYPYYGRGFVQITWKNNYEKYSKLLGVDLVNNPDLAMEPGIALFILVHGFKTGTFTGRKISDYINRGQTDFVNARRCINGRDHADDIARLADKFLRAL